MLRIAPSPCPPVGAATASAGLSPPCFGKKLTTPPGETPVLLLQGMLATPDAMNGIGEALRPLGFHPYVGIPGMHLPFVNPHASEAAVARAIEGVQQETGQNPFAVGWSLGGRLAGDQDGLAGVVTLGSPHKRKRTRNAHPLSSLYSWADVVVPPPLSMISGENTTSEALPGGVLHWHLPADATVIAIVGKRLTAMREGLTTVAGQRSRRK